MLDNAQHTPPTAAAQTRRALALEEAALAGCEAELKDEPDRADLLVERDETLKSIEALRRELTKHEQRELRAERDAKASKEVRLRRLSALVVAAKQPSQKRSIKTQEATLKLEALAAVLAELNAIDAEASAAYAAAIMPMVGVDRFTRSPALQIGNLPCSLFDAIAAVITAHAHDAQTPLEAARAHADRVADTLDAEMERQTTTDEGAER